MINVSERLWFLVLKGTWVNKNREGFVVQILSDAVSTIHYRFAEDMMCGGLVGSIPRQEFLERFKTIKEDLT